jgi:hypothetical protein
VLRASLAPEFNGSSRWPAASQGKPLGSRRATRGVGFATGLLLGILGAVIVALMPETEAAKAARAQRQYEIQAEAARRAGYPFPPQQGPWQPYQDW